MISGKVEDEVYDEEDEAEESASGIGRGMGAARETVGGEGRGACERGRRGLLAGVRGEEDGGAGGDMVVAILWGGWKRSNGGGSELAARRVPWKRSFAAAGSASAMLKMAGSGYRRFARSRLYEYILVVMRFYYCI